MTDTFKNKPTFDESALDQFHELQTEGEPSFIGGLICDYLAQLNDFKEQLLSFEMHGDHRGLEDTAHKLKSSSALLGLSQLAALCFAIEARARACRPTSDYVQLLGQAVTDAEAKLKAYLKTLS